MTAAKPEKEKSWRDLWEWKAALMILRTMAALMFIGYLLGTYMMPYQWGHVKWVRSQPLETLPQVAEKYLAKNDNRGLLRWASERPIFERPDIIRLLEPYNGRIDSTAFVLFSNWSMARGDVTEAMFWWQYALYRLRFDTLRCGSPGAIKNMAGLVQIFENREVIAAVNKNAGKIPAMIQRVLDHDAKYPMENDPAEICKPLQKLDGKGFKVVPRMQWPIIRHTLRVTTEGSLRDMKGTP